MPINLTERASKHIKKFLENKKESIGIRIGIKKSGCSGFSYVVEYVITPKLNDIIFECMNIKIFIDSDHLSYLKGAELDYIKEDFQEGFKFNNPNEKAACGCGESFMF